MDLQIHAGKKFSPAQDEHRFALAQPVVKSTGRAANSDKD
jgi:hypothetical protein